MADVVVAGAGLGGLAAAARLAKLGHRVTVYDRQQVAGGVLRPVRADGFEWDGGPSSTPLPAVLRDLFHSSGRPLERYVELVARDVIRRHVFPDGTTVDLPGGSRGRQIAAVDEGLGPGAGTAWAAYVDGLGETWETMRSHVLDPPGGGAALGDRALARRLRARTSLATLLRGRLADHRLQTMAAHSFLTAGSRLADVPAYAAVDPYVERSFGVWDVAGGMATLVDALLTRLEERGVTVHLGVEVTAVLTDGDTVTGVQTTTGGEATDAALRRADVVVTDLDPRLVFGRLLEHPTAARARRVFDVAATVLPMDATHVGLAGECPALPAEVVLHGDPLIVLTTTGSAPAGRAAWTIRHRSGPGEDVVSTLATRGVDIRGAVVTRVDKTAAQQLHEAGGSSYGLAWAGHRAHARRAALVHPLPGLHLVGAGVHPGATVPYVGWGAAHVASRVGPVPRRAARG